MVHKKSIKNLWIPIHTNTGELQEALVPIVELEKCAKMWHPNRKVTNKTICAGGLNTRDACRVCTIVTAS